MNFLLLRLKRFCGFIAGFVFFIAGIFKLLDPVGAGLVMKEYMDFLHVSFLSGIAKPAAAMLAFLETLIGTALVTGIWRRLTAVFALAFQMFFTDGEHLQLLTAFQHGIQPLIAFGFVPVSILCDSVQRSGDILSGRAGKSQGNFRTLQTHSNDLFRCIA